MARVGGPVRQVGGGAPGGGGAVGGRRLARTFKRQALGEFAYTLELSENLAGELVKLGEWAKEEGNIDADTELPQYPDRLDPVVLPDGR